MNPGIGLLQQVGFVQVGCWRLNGDSIRYELEARVHGPGVLYAFTSGESVLYVGKSTRRLDERMQNYKTPGSATALNRGRTNVSNYSRIQSALLAGQEICIWVFVNEEPVHFRGVKVNIAAGIEDKLVRLIKPPWNGSTKLD